MKTMITMKIRITESQYNILVNKPRDVVFGKINETPNPDGINNIWCFK